MTNEAIKLNVIDGIYDIQPLVTPNMSSLELTLLSLCILLTISILFYFTWFLFYSNKGTAKRNIKNLHSDFILDDSNKHDTIYQLYAFLRQGLRLKEINQHTQLPNSLYEHKAEWEKFTVKVSKLRYSKSNKTHSDINIFFQESLYWLKLWP